MLVTILLGLWLTMVAARGTPIGRAMHHMLIEAPARRLSHIRRGQLLLALTLAGAAFALIWLLENDGRLLVAMGLPEVMSFAAAIDLASLLDLAVVAVIAASGIRVRAVRAAIVRRVGLRRPGGRAIRVRRAPAPANDDEDHRTVPIGRAA